MNFPDRLAARAAEIQSCLDAAVAVGAAGPMAEPMHYAVSGGKRLRGCLVMESALLHGVGKDRSVWAAAAIEAMHAYSLVHDDLPCMDDDDLRRGQPTVHVRWDQATAVLAGDALQALAFELLARDDVGDAACRVALTGSLAQAAGAQGMVLGQALDIAAETAAAPLDLGQITALQAGKTGALIEWSCVAGAILGGADPAPLRRYAGALGLAFQIADDILDVEGDSAVAGKRLQKDADAGKATFVSLLGLQGAKARAAELVAEAEAAIEPYGEAAETLRQAARFVISRQM